MPPMSSGAGPNHAPTDRLIRELMGELGRAFDLSTSLGERTLGDAVEGKIRELDLEDTPDWGTDGSLTQLARKGSEALDFYYRPHLFPGMEETLRLGHHLQFGLLPRRLPAGSPLRVAAVLESYCHLSGDLLGWRLERDELFLWIADVSGHGVRAGLAGATLYFLIGSIEPGLEPEVFARRANEGMLAARNESDTKALFATAIWLRARADGTIRWASAGHNPALVLRSDGAVGTLDATGPPIGLLEGETTYERNELRLGEDDALCLYTDGLVEAVDAEGEEYGVERLADLCRGHAGSPMELTRAIYEAVRAHQGSNLLGDDLTFMVAQPADAAGAG